MIPKFASYAEWKSGFLELFHSNRLNAYYVDEFTRYCLQVSKNNVLSPPNQSDTDEFVDDFLPLVIDSILQTRTTLKSATLYKLLESSTRLFKKLLISDHEPFISSARQILENPKSPYYSDTFNPSYISDQYVSLCQIFAHSSTISSISSFFEQQISTINFSKINSIFEILVPITGYFTVEEIDNFVIDFLKLFSTRINGVDIREINENEINQIFLNFERFEISQEVRSQIFIKHIEFLMKFVNSDLLTKQFSSLNCIKGLILSQPDRISSILQQVSLIPHLLKSDLHVNLIDSFSTIFSIMCERGSTTKTDLATFWSQTLDQPQSTLLTFLSGIKKVTDKMDPNELFIHIIIDTGKFPDCVLDYIGFLSFKCRSIPTKKLMFDALMKEYYNRHKSETENDLALLIKTIGQYVCEYDSTFSEEPQHKCIENIENEKDVKLSLHILKCIFQNASSEDAHKYFNIIITKIDKNESLEYLNLLVQFLKKFQTPLTQHEFDQIKEITINLSSDQVIDFYSSLIDDAVTRVPLLDHQMRLSVLGFFCDKDFSSRVFHFIQTLYYQFKSREFEGIEYIWSFLFKTNRYEISQMLIHEYMKGDNVEKFIDSCSKNFNSEGSLFTLLNFIHLLQDGISLQPGPNCFLFQDDYVRVNFIGDVQFVSQLQKDTCYNGFLRIIEQQASIDSSQISCYLDNQQFTKSTYNLYDNMSIQVRIIQPRRPPRPLQYTLPSQVLVQSQYYLKLFNLLCESEDSKISNYVLRILNLLPTSKAILDELNSDEIDWDDFLCIDMPYLLLYKLNTICNCLTNQTDKFMTIFYPNGMIRLLFLIFNVASSIFADNQSLITALRFTIYLLNCSNQYKQSIIDAVKDSVPTLLEWIQNVADDDNGGYLLGYLMQLLTTFQMIAQSLPEFNLLIQKTIFHKNKNIRSYSLWLIDSSQLSQQQKEDLIIPLLSQAQNPDCDEYFTILVKILQTTENKDSIWSILTEHLYNHCSLPQEGNILDIFLFMPPPINYVHGLFNAMNVLIAKLDEIPEMRKLFDFIRSEIIFNEYKYYQPTSEMFHVFMHLLNKEPSFNEILQPTLDACKEFRLSQSTDNFDLSATARDRGIRNMGATCYINSTIQQLYNIKKFRESLLMHDFDENDWSFEFQYVFAKLALFPSKYIEITNFLSKWRGYDNEIIDVHQQQDSVEFLQLLLDRLEKIMPRTISMFQGEIEHKTIYDENNISTNIENFPIFSIDVKNQESIEDSLKNFLVPDKFEYQTETKQKREAIRLHKMKKAPEILIVQLKRFEFNLQTNQRKKINSKFNFSNKLDLSTIMTDSVPVSYELCGIVQHCGTAMGGHYFSDIKKDDNNWLCMNDTCVSSIDEERLLIEAAGGDEEIYSITSGYNKTLFDHSCNAYLLFYKRTTNERNMKLIDTELIKASLGHLSVESFSTLDNENSSTEQINMNCPGFNSKLIGRLLPEIKTTILRAVCNSSPFSELVMNICSSNPNGEFLYSHFTNCLSMQSDQQSRQKLVENCNRLFKSDPQFCDFVLSQHNDFFEFAIRNSNLSIRQDYLNLIDYALSSCSNDSLLKFHMHLIQLMANPISLVSYWSAINGFFTVFEKSIPNVVSSDQIAISLLLLVVEGPKSYNEIHSDDQIYQKIDLSYPLNLLIKYSITDEVKKAALNQLIESSTLLELTKSVYHQVSFNKYLSHILSQENTPKVLIQYINQNEASISMQAYASFFNAIVSISKEEHVRQFLSVISKRPSLTLFFENLTSLPNKNVEQYINAANLFIEKFLITKNSELRYQIQHFFFKLLPEFPYPPIGKIENPSKLPLLEMLYQRVISCLPNLYSYLKSLEYSYREEKYFPTQEYYDLLSWVIISGGLISQLDFPLMISTLKQYKDLDMPIPQFHLFNMLANLFGKELFNHIPVAQLIGIIEHNSIKYIFGNLLAIIPKENSGPFIKSALFANICKHGFSNDSSRFPVDAFTAIESLLTSDNALLIAQVLADRQFCGRHFSNKKYLRCCWRLMKKYPQTYRPFFKEDIHLDLFELIYQGNRYESMPHNNSRPLSKWVAVFNNAFYADNKDKKYMLVTTQILHLYKKYMSVLTSDMFNRYRIETFLDWIRKDCFQSSHGNLGYFQIVRSLIKLSSSSDIFFKKLLTFKDSIVLKYPVSEAMMLICDICHETNPGPQVEQVLFREFQSTDIANVKNLEGFAYFFSTFEKYDFQRIDDFGHSITNHFLTINDIRFLSDSFTKFTVYDNHIRPLFTTDTILLLLDSARTLISNEIKSSLRTGISIEDFRQSVMHIESAVNFVDQVTTMAKAPKTRLEDVDSHQIDAFNQDLGNYQIRTLAPKTMAYLSNNR